MTDSTIVLLPTLSSLSGTEVTYVVSGGVDYQTTTQAIADLGGGGGGGAPTNATYVTLSTNGTLTNERVLTAGTGISLTDGGAGGNITVATSITQYTDELAQDAVGAMIDSTLVYVDGTPLLTRAALTGDVTASQGSNATTIASGAVSTSKLGGDITTAGKALLDDADASAQRTTLSAAARTQTFAIQFGLAAGTNDKYIIDSKAYFGYTIDSVRAIKTTSGTISAAFKINSTNVTSLSAVSVTATPQDISATGANTVAVGDEVSVTFSSNSSATFVTFLIGCTRTLA